MGNKIFLFLFVFLVPGLFAQEEMEKSYFIDDSSGTPRFIQRLSWYPEDYTSRYEVRVESRLADGSYREVLRRSTPEEYLDISLPPGLYRYRVQSFDLLEKPAGNPPWINLEVFPALKPEIGSISPDTLSSGRQVSFTIEGRNLVEGGQVILRNRESGREATGQLSPETGGRRAQLLFSSLTAGSYDVIIENPGGLSASAGPVTVLPSTPWTFSLAIGYAPLFPLNGQINEMLESKVYPLGFFARISTMPFEWKGFEFGMEAAAGWAYLSSDYSDGGLSYEVTGHFADLRLHFLAQKWLADGRFALRGQLGGGLAAAIHFQKKITGLSTEAVNVLYPLGSLGIAALWPFTEKYYALFGMEYLYLFSKDQSNPGFFVPFIGIGMEL